MSKKTESQNLEPKPLPFTNAETAEQRLEELVRNKSIKHFRVMSANENYTLWPLEGECRTYPDGFEGVSYTGDSYGNGSYFGNLYLDRRRAYVTYDLEKDYKNQILVKEGIK